MAHAHDHSDDHSHEDPGHPHHVRGHRGRERVLAVALVLTLAFMVVEAISGFIADSLALIADAGHMLTDAAALGLAFAAVHFASRPPDSKRSFGYHRFQVLATFVNGMALLLIVGWIAYEAFAKLFEPRVVNAKLMLAVAALGALVNIIVFTMLKRGAHSHDEDMNIAAATLHVLGDLLGSIGAMIAAIVIWVSDWTPIDSILSLALCFLIVRSAWTLVRKSTHILLEGAPDWLDVPKLRSTLIERVPAILDVHHVHCWSLSPRETLLTLHLTVTGQADHTATLAASQRVLSENYGITHATIQIEQGPCVDSSCQ